MAVRQTFTQGNLTTTNNPLDLAINGDGFFMVGRDNGPDVYTRNGQFELDKEGFIRTPTGEKLKGFQSPVTPGALPTPIGGLKDIQIPIVGSQPMPTSRVEIGGNLDANDLSAAERYPQLFGSTFTFPLALGRELAGCADLQLLDLDQGLRQPGEIARAHLLLREGDADRYGPSLQRQTQREHLEGLYERGWELSAQLNNDGSPNPAQPNMVWTLTFNEKGTGRTRRSPGRQRPIR